MRTVHLDPVVDVEAAAGLEEEVLGLAAEGRGLAVVEPPQYVLNGHLLPVTADDGPVFAVGQYAHFTGDTFADDTGY